MSPAEKGALAEEVLQFFYLIASRRHAAAVNWRDIGTPRWQLVDKTTLLCPIHGSGLEEPNALLLRGKRRHSVGIHMNSIPYRCPQLHTADPASCLQLAERRLATSRASRLVRLSSRYDGLAARSSRSRTRRHVTAFQFFSAAVALLIEAFKKRSPDVGTEAANPQDPGTFFGQLLPK
jgi:hypothetical protein